MARGVRRERRAAMATATTGAGAAGASAVTSNNNNPFQSASLYIGDLANDISEVQLQLLP